MRLKTNNRSGSMKKLIYIIAFLPGFAFAQSYLHNSGATVRISAGTEVRVEDGGVTNNTSGTINNDGNIYLDRNWTQSASSYLGTGWMWFEGSTNQVMNATSVPRLRVDNGNLLILGSNVVVSTQVDLMNNGRIQLGNNNLRVSSGGTIIGYDNINHIKTNGTGSLHQTIGSASGTITFPVGRSSYNPAFLSNSGTTDEFAVRVEDIVYQQGTTGSPETNNIVDRTWYIEESVIGGSNSNLTLRWNTTDEVASFNRASSSITHWDGGGWITYNYIAATNVGSGYYEQNWPGVNTFSPFAVQDDNEPLPVTLVDFTAFREDAATARLNWNTMNEVRNQGFAIERRLSNEADFTEVGWVDGAGTTSSPQSYQLLDPNSWTDLSHYRLRIVDMDGNFDYSEVRTINGLDGQPTITMWPNPVANDLQLLFEHFGEETVQVQIWSADGKQIFDQPLEINGREQFTITQTSQLAEGLYSLQVIMEGRAMYTKKFLKLGL
jgi:hypothetical protein